MKRFVSFILWLGLASAFFMMLLIAYWLLAPHDIVRVDEPMLINNVNREIAIGETILLEATYTKNEDKQATVFPTIQCKSGNLVTLTSSETSFPVGTNTIVIDDYVLQKVLVGDECQVVLQLVYQHNPIHKAYYNFVSEFFVVVEKR